MNISSHIHSFNKFKSRNSIHHSIVSEENKSLHDKAKSFNGNKIINLLISAVN